jgi:hypothetical protein
MKNSIPVPVDLLGGRADAVPAQTGLSGAGTKGGSRIHFIGVGQTEDVVFPDTIELLVIDVGFL